jgi:signal transduction histidine kinase
MPSVPAAARWVAPLATVRARTTLAASLVVGIALAVGAAALLLTLRQALVRSGDDSAQIRARDLATLAAADALPPTLTVPGEDDIAQVVDQSGHVLAASPSHADRPVATFTPTSDEPAVRTITAVTDGSEHEDYRVWALRTQSPRGQLTVYVATSLESVGETMATVRVALAVGLPPLLGLLALSTWHLLGRALRPVEAIRAEVADITEQALDRRVPVPPTADEIGRLARTMNATLDRLQAASERQRAFVADASHELQSPLAALRTQLEVAAAHPSATDWPATAAILLADSQRMERLVRDLLFLARNDDTPGPRPAGPVDLDDIVLDEVIRLRAMTQVYVDTSRVSAAPLYGSRDELTRLTRNLLENAARHAASTVRIELAIDDHTVHLAVEDDGPGIPTEQRQRIFDRFARLDDARARGSGGTGLGLAIVKSIAERHGGTVAVESTGSAGSAGSVESAGSVGSVEGGSPDGHPGARFVVRLGGAREPGADTARSHPDTPA